MSRLKAQNSRRPGKRQRPPTKTDRVRDAELVNIPAVRIVLSRVRVSPAVAFVIAEAAGLLSMGGR